MKENYTVKDQYRTNLLSKQEGGDVIEVLQKDGRVLTYDKIKNPDAYIRKMNKENLVKIFLNANLVWEQK